MQMNRTTSKTASAIGADGKRVVRPLRFEGDNTALVKALQSDHPGAYKTLYHRFSPSVHRVLMRVMGPDVEMETLIQEVFIRAFRKVNSIKEPEKLESWLSGIAVFVARGEIRRRKRARWLQFFEPSSLPDISVEGVDDNARRALECTYRLLEKLSAESRIVFSLRYIDGRELNEIAEMCGMSVATVKRRIRSAKGRFFAMAKNEAELQEWIGDD